MTKKYRNTSIIEAEQFDASDGMMRKYRIKSFQSINPDFKEPPIFEIETLEGQLSVGIGDWIATDINGEHWPIKDEIFRKTYEEVVDNV